MRVLTISSEYPPVRSGVATTVGRLVGGLRARGFEVDVLHAGDGPELVVGELRFPTIATRFGRLRKLVTGYDLVHLHGPAPLISDVFLVRSLLGSHPPLLYTHHFSIELEGVRVANDLYNLAHRRLAGVADHVVVTTPSYAAHLQLPGRPPPEVIPWAVDADRLSGGRMSWFDGSRPLRVLFLGQMRPYKGIPVLVEATAGQPELEVTIAGGGPLLDRYRELVRRAPAPRPSILGAVPTDRARALFGAHDVVVLPSVNRLEAFGLVLLEGMAAGCVPVASAWRGVRDVAGLTGVVVAPKDPVSLRRALLELARDPEGTAARQQASMEMARRFRWEDTVERYARRMRAMLGVPIDEGPPVVTDAADGSRPAVAAHGLRGSATRWFIW